MGSALTRELAVVLCSPAFGLGQAAGLGGEEGGSTHWYREGWVWPQSTGGTARNPCHLPRQHCSYSSHLTSCEGEQLTRDCDRPFTGVSWGRTTNLWGWQDFSHFKKESRLFQNSAWKSKLLTPKSKGQRLHHSGPEAFETHKTGQIWTRFFSVKSKMGLGFPLKIIHSVIQRATAI